MNWSSFATVLCRTCLAVGLLCRPAVSSAETESLFDGKTLAGWQGDSRYWRVEQGAIVGEIPAGQNLDHNTWLVWQGQPLDDFELTLKFRLTGAAAANSGIQFRCQAHDFNHVAGYQADLDMGAVWLGRIYDEEGRALLVERGSQVRIGADGQSNVEVFAPPHTFAVLFREHDWNDYRIVAHGHRVTLYINGTRFSELDDQQVDSVDLSGQVALQLHAGPETRIEFRQLELHRRSGDDGPLPPLVFQPTATATEPVGAAPVDIHGKVVELSFEQGELAPWVATGNAFQQQPVREDGISSRWPGQQSHKAGEYFIGGYERVGDAATGTLTSPVVKITHPYVSLLVGGGRDATTRIEVVAVDANQQPVGVLAQASGQDREQMRRVVFDLRQHLGKPIVIRAIDEGRGAWGHLNLDDVRFHETPPVDATTDVWRSTSNPVLQQLVANPAPQAKQGPAADTLSQMFVPRGFSVDLVAAEPDLHQPIAFAFDAKGRLWVAEAYSYPQKRPNGEGLDRILIFADADGDGRFEQRHVFAEHLNLVSAIEVGFGGVWIGAAPELLFLPDRDGDDRPDGPPVVVLDGFGYADTHETLNNFSWGPDGWLYGNQGVFNGSAIGKPGEPAASRQVMQAGVWRYHPLRKTFEVFAHGGSNQWGLDFDDLGQLFMTHCRSFWGQGLTTHVMQGGQYWNQVNSGYADFISASQLPDRPHMKNYLLASARYGHGEGGAGKPGSGEVYGGHSHVGTMFYLGDNWPREFRNHLFTHNLHGHQINHQVNEREAGGFNTRHAGADVLFCGDPRYIAVDLQVGPDGTVYISDWYDVRHCHNPNVEHWDRGNGRIYRMKYDATYRPVVVDYTTASDTQLVAAQRHHNDWHVRVARLELADRAAHGRLSDEAVAELVTMLREETSVPRRLRAMWALACIQRFDDVIFQLALQDENEFIRGWAIQLGAESLDAARIGSSLQQVAEHDTSLLVRRYLASAVQRVPESLGWSLVETLARQPENADDRDLPLLLWYGIAKLAPHDWVRALALADRTQIPQLSDYLLWYAAKQTPRGRDVLVTRLPQATGEAQVRLLELLALALRDLRGDQAPTGWAAIASTLYDSSEPRLREAAESIGSRFGDSRLFERMRGRLADPQAQINDQRRAIEILANDHSETNLPLLLQALEHPELRPGILPLLTEFRSPNVAESLIPPLPTWNDADRTAALEVLASRVAWSDSLLTAIQEQRLPKQILTAYIVRQMSLLNDAPLNERLANQWGSLSHSTAEVKAQIESILDSYQEAPLWAYEGEVGATHFNKLCASCHQATNQQENIAPKLAGTSAKGIAYLVENLVDPNAVIGKDYQARVLTLHDGRTLSGLIESETESAIVLRTATARVTLAKAEVEAIHVSSQSFMPTGLLDTLSERERIELLKYVMSL